jgi:hypothetical protein
MVGPKRKKVAGSWRKLHNEDRASSHIIRLIKSVRLMRAGHVTLTTETRSIYIIFVGRLNGRPRHRWEKN